MISSRGLCGAVAGLWTCLLMAAPPLLSGQQPNAPQGLRRARDATRAGIGLAIPAISSHVDPQDATPSETLTIKGRITSTLESLYATSNRKIFRQTRTAKESTDGKSNIAKYFTNAQRKGATAAQGSCSTGNYFRDCTVQVSGEKDGEKDKVLATAQTDDEGRFTLKVPGSERHTPMTLSTEADNFFTKRTIVFSQDQTTYVVDLPLEDRPVSLLSRAIVGYEQAGASSAKADQKFFFDFYISKPFPVIGKIDPDFGQRVRTWGDIRVASVPQPGSAEVGAFAAGFAQQVSSLKVGEIARSLQFLGGVEILLTGNDALLPSFDRQTRQKFSLSFAAGFGAITPINPRDTMQVFQVFPGAPGLPKEAEGKDFVAFVSSERDRFFRQYYGGLRFQTFFFNRFDRPLQRFPGMLDVMYGQDEFVTRGHFRGGVFRIDGYFPLPYNGLKYINLFGTALLKPGRAKETVPLILQPAPVGTPVPATNVAIVVAPQQTRDYYRVGVGMDFVSFVQTLKEYLSKKK